MGRVNKGDCIGVDSMTIASGTASQNITCSYPNATKALIQVWTDAAGITAIGTDVMAYQPLAVLNETGSAAVSGYAGTKGLFLFHMAMYEIETKQNIDAAQIIPFTTGYNTYVRINYYK